MQKPKVWFVDDLQSNLDAFTEAHKNSFQVETFLRTQEVLDRLTNDQPDALLCDIFFYDNPVDAEAFENEIQKKASELRRFGKKIHANDDRYTAGIDLIAAVDEKFPSNLDGPARFPVYAYTSKGPYLLGTQAWDRIVGHGARILPKGSLGREAEGLALRRDIDHYWKEQKEFEAKRKITSRLRRIAVTTGLIGSLLGVVLDRLTLLILGI